MRQILFGLSIGLLFTFTASTICYQCASDGMLENWSRYGLPMAEGDSFIGDPGCTHDENVTQTTVCDGLCVLMNVTTMHKGKLRRMGVLRDCQRYWKEPKEVIDGKECRQVEKELNRRLTVTISYCFCEDDHCNGPHPGLKRLVAASKAGQHTRKRSSSIAGVFGGFLIFLVVAVVGSFF